MTTKFTVTGRGEFPVDMLRYDRCYPKDGLSAANILHPTSETREVVLVTESDYHPTPDRWGSFLWACRIDNPI